MGRGDVRKDRTWREPNSDETNKQKLLEHDSPKGRGRT